MDDEEKITKIIQCFYKTYNALGYGFLEKVYENAFAIELADEGLKYKQQHQIKIHYKNKLVGNYIADFFVENIIVEIKACKQLENIHIAQTINYLKATKMKKGILLNFGVKPQVKRIIF